MTTHTKVRELLALGMANKQIARAAGIAPCTVKYHLSRIFAELGAANRKQAANALNRR